MPARMTVVGDDKTRQSLEDISVALHGQQATNAMYRAANLLLRDAKKFSPVDTGRLRNSITSQVRTVGISRKMQGVVGTNVKYAPFMEYGTDHNKMPPISALEGWARRHGANAFVVAQAILRNGGLKGHFFFTKSFEKNSQQVIKILQDHVSNSINNS